MFPVVKDGEVGRKLTNDVVRRTESFEVKRTESQRDSKRFLDSTPRISFAKLVNPLLNTRSKKYFIFNFLE